MTSESAFSSSANPSVRAIAELPGPAGLPLIGNLHQLSLARIHRILENWSTQYGDLYTFRLTNRTCLVVTDPVLIAEVLKTRPQTYRRFSALASVLDELIGPNVFSAEGAAWRPQRKLVMEAVHARHVRTTHDTLVKVTQRLLDRWRRAARGGAVVDVQDDLLRFTIDATTMLAFGIDVNSLENEQGVMHEHFSHIFPALIRRMLSPVPYWRYVKLPVDRALDAALVELRKHIATLIENARERLASEPLLRANPTNFIQTMLMVRDEDGRPFSDETIVGNCFAILGAGEDTTANTIAWMIHFLCDHADAQNRLHREAAEALGEDDIAPDPATLEKLLYCTATMNETLRLKPVVGTQILEANQNTVLGNVHVPKGTIVWTVSGAPAVRASIFERAQTFDPDGFMDKQSSAQQAAFVPFGAGVRICPGRGLAITETRLVVSMLAKHFHIVREGEAEDVHEAFRFTMMPAGLRVKLIER